MAVAGKRKEHTGFRNGDLFCFHCGQSYKMNLPQPLDMAAAMMKQFAKSHKYCEKTWGEPVVDQTKSVHDKAMFWKAMGEHGNSSLAIWNTLMGNRGYTSHPYDPDDFSRCYKLLQIVPEWREQLHKMKPLSTEWSNLVDNWDKLTEMYERNESEGWANASKIDMYGFMKRLID